MFCVCTLPVKLQPSGFLPNKSGVYVFNQKNKMGKFFCLLIKKIWEFFTYSLHSCKTLLEMKKKKNGVLGGMILL